MVELVTLESVLEEATRVMVVQEFVEWVGVGDGFGRRRSEWY